MMDFVHQEQAGSTSTSFECVPVEFVEHLGHTLPMMVVAEDESCCSALDHLDVIDVVPGVRVPDGGTVFQVWADKGEVGLSTQ